MPDRTLAYHLGADFAFNHDYTALCLASVRERRRLVPPLPLPVDGSAPPRREPMQAPMETYFHVEMLDRLPHNMPETEQAHHIAGVFADIYQTLLATYNPHGFGAKPELPPRYLYADATGIGGPVLRLIRQVIQDDPRTRDVWVYGLTFRPGEKFDRAAGVLGKLYLVSNLQALWAAGRIDLPQGDPLTDATLREISDYRIEISQDGHETFGGKSGSHDDLVTALGLACVDSGPRGVTYYSPPPGVGW